MENQIVVIGSSNVDLIMQVARLPKPGETLTNGVFHQLLGGKGANQAISAARAGGKVGFISSLGADLYGDKMVEAFQEAGLNTQYIARIRDIPSGMAMIRVDNQGENSISVAPGANHALAPEHIQLANPLLSQAAFVLLQCELDPLTRDYVINHCHQLGKRVILNLAPAIAIGDSYLGKLFLLIVNETEAEFLLGESLSTYSDVQKVAATLRSKVERVIITLGKQGSYVSSPEFEGHISAFSVQAVDTTAAGDVFCGSLTAALCEGMTMSKAIRFASAASAIAVTRLGAQASVPYREEIEKFLIANND